MWCCPGRQGEQQFGVDQPGQSDHAHGEGNGGAGPGRGQQLATVAIAVGGGASDGAEDQRRHHGGGADNPQPGKRMGQLPGQPLDTGPVDPYGHVVDQLPGPEQTVIAAFKGKGDAAGKFVH